MCWHVSGLTYGVVVGIIVGAVIFVLLFICVIQLCYKYVHVCYCAVYKVVHRKWNIHVLH